MKQGDVGRTKKFVASNRIDLTGQYFGRLKVLCYYNTADDKDRKAKWLCECACGRFKVISGKSLRDGDTKSCGCIKEEQKHPLCNTRLHSIWKNMKTRCYLPSKPCFKRYGARGIVVCNDWKNSFSSFAEWAIGSGYRDSLTLDRIDNNGDYTPKNCRWVTRQRQSNNMASNHLVTFNGRTQTLMDWSRETGIPHSTLWKRLKEGWTEEEALTIKPTVGTNGYNGERLRSRRADLESL